jgi:mono/diheme cytochrome c family protein
MTMKNVFTIIVPILLIFLFSGCEKHRQRAPQEDLKPITSTNLGIGPIQNEISLEPIDPQKALLGEKIFQVKCSNCHQFDKSGMGPALRGVTQRRRPEWLLNLLLNPVEMVQKDPALQAMHDFYFNPMPFQEVKPEDARDLLEYFRQYDAQGPQNP